MAVIGAVDSKPVLKQSQKLQGNQLKGLHQKQQNLRSKSHKSKQTDSFQLSPPSRSQFAPYKNAKLNKK